MQHQEGHSPAGENATILIMENASSRSHVGIYFEYWDKRGDNDDNFDAGVALGVNKGVRRRWTTTHLGIAY